MPNIQFDTGIQEYTLNDKVTVTFNPTDTNIAKKIVETIESLDDIQEEIERSVSDSKNTFQVLDDIDKRMRSEIDELFHKPICDELFGYTNVFAYSDGFPIWANLLFAVLEFMTDSYSEEQKKTNPRMAKYIKKYKK